MNGRPSELEGMPVNVTLKGRTHQSEQMTTDSCVSTISQVCFVEPRRTSNVHVTMVKCFSARDNDHIAHRFVLLGSASLLALYICFCHAPVLLSHPALRVCLFLVAILIHSHATDSSNAPNTRCSCRSACSIVAMLSHVALFSHLVCV